MKKNILVTGGAGFIGSHVVRLLASKEYFPITVDNLSRGSNKSVLDGEVIQGDISDIKLLEKIFSTHKIDGVIHLAASLDVGESVKNPAKYYHNNVCNTIGLLDTMHKYGVDKIIFSSSAGIFGNPQKEKIDESHPVHPINPYGKTKLVVEMMLEDYDTAYGIKSSCLRYFNAAGGDPDGIIKNLRQHEHNLIPIVLNNLGKRPVTIFGTDYPTRDGTCIRDYVHVMDLATAHTLAYDNLDKNRISTRFNLGNGNGFSVREVIDAVARVTGKRVDVVEGDRRAGDPALLIADSSKARKELGWMPKYPDLETIILHAYQSRS